MKNSTPPRFLQIRRMGDQRRLIFYYCAIGLILGLSQVAFGAETCASNFKEIELSGSDLLKKALPILKGKGSTKGFNNVSEGSHMEFVEENGKVVLQYFSTNIEGVFNKSVVPQYYDSQVKFCERNGKLIVETDTMMGNIEVQIESSCYVLMSFKSGIWSVAQDDLAPRKFCESNNLPKQVERKFAEANHPAWANRNLLRTNNKVVATVGQTAPASSSNSAAQLPNQIAQ